MFFYRLKELGGANGQWGLFSMAIPGRVGYQCSNFYRMLIETKAIKDPNYFLDDKGKAHYKFSTRMAKVNAALNGEVIHTGTRKSSRKSKKRKDSMNSDSDGEYGAGKKSGGKKSRSLRASSVSLDEDMSDMDEYDPEIVKKSQNPLPGFLDPITLEEVVRPAISPYGHVMG